MSIEVPLPDLAAEVANRGPGYLLTATTDSRPHVMHLNFAADGPVLRTDVGRSAARNIVAQPAVTLLWPPPEPGGYSLIVDGEAAIEGEATAVVTATHAVLHRPA